MTNDTRFSEAMDRIRLRFLTQLDEHVARLLDLGASIGSGIDSGFDSGSPISAALSQVRFRAHKILGTAATLGFDQLGRLAAICEKDMESCLRIAVPSPSQIARHLESLDHLIAEIEALIERDAGQQV
jgi:chemotaxis protein histidine kinase CheA